MLDSSTSSHGILISRIASHSRRSSKEAKCRLPCSKRFCIANASRRKGRVANNDANIDLLCQSSQGSTGYVKTNWWNNGHRLSVQKELPGKLQPLRINHGHRVQCWWLGSDQEHDSNVPTQRDIWKLSGVCLFGAHKRLLQALEWLEDRKSWRAWLHRIWNGNCPDWELTGLQLLGRVNFHESCWLPRRRTVQSASRHNHQGFARND